MSNTNTASNRSQATGTATPDLHFILVCKAYNTRPFVNILSAIQNTTKKDQQTALCTLSRNGIKFTVEEGKIFQAHTFLQSELFPEYHWSDEYGDSRVHFKINLSILMDCLNIFGGSGAGYTSLQILYAGYGSPLELMLEEAGVVTTCSIKTLEPEEELDFDFRGPGVPNKVIMDAEGLRDAFSELDWSSPSISVLLSPEAPYFRVSTATPTGSFEAEYPKESDIFESFECSRTLEHMYKISVLQACFKALAHANKTQIRMNANGVLSFQHMIKVEDQPGFVDFFILPESSPDDSQ